MRFRVLGFLFSFLLIFARGFGLSIHEAKFRLGERLFNANRHVEAAPEFLSVIRDHPESSWVNSSLFYLARIEAASGRHETALSYYQRLSGRAHTLAHRRQALFGMAESFYRLGDFSRAGQLYLTFALEHRDSPARPAALFYGADALRRISMDRDAELLARTLIQEYPTHGFSTRITGVGPIHTPAAAPTATPKAPAESLAPRPVPTPEPDATTQARLRDAASLGHAPLQDSKTQAGVRESSGVTEHTRRREPQAPAASPLPASAVDVAPVISTNWMTNWIDVYQTNIEAVALTNSLVLTNRFYLPGETPAPDAAEIERAREASRREQESIARYQAMVELKARLLDIKERTLREKERILLESRE